MSQLVLSLFPGIDLLGRGFEQEGFCVVRGPDKITGGDIRDFSPPAGRFDGVIGGSPCPDFSSLRRVEPTGDGVAMLREFLRVVDAARPVWFLLENVPAVPDVELAGYTVQRFDLRANECGLPQRRLRHFQFGSRLGQVLVLDRGRRVPVTLPAAVASDDRRDWSEFCQSQGLPATFDLPAFRRSEKYRAVGNGVPVPMAAFIARCIRFSLLPADMVRVCPCGCGRLLAGRQVAAGAACRKRLERRRRCDRVAVTGPGAVTVAESQFCDVPAVLEAGSVTVAA